MKVTWLNAERTEAIITRGWWWWKRQAQVERTESRPGAYTSWWVFTGSRYYVRPSRNRWLEGQRVDAEQVGDWVPVGTLPVAKVVIK
jgi:hypothetical protein